MDEKRTEREQVVLYLRDLAENVAAPMKNRDMYATLMAAALGIEKGDHLEPGPAELQN